MKSLLMINSLIIGASWIGIYLLMTILSLLILLLYPLTPNEERGLWTEFSVALGFIGLAMMALQFALTARIN